MTFTPQPIKARDGKIMTISIKKKQPIQTQKETCDSPKYSLFCASPGNARERKILK
jgi:hypothetical protein